MDNAELNHYRAVCYIQDEFIKGEISREEMEQKLEIQRLKFIECLRQQNEWLIKQTYQEKKFAEFIDTYCNRKENNNGTSRESKRN